MGLLVQSHCQEAAGVTGRDSHPCTGRRAHGKGLHGRGVAGPSLFCLSPPLPCRVLCEEMAAEYGRSRTTGPPPGCPGWVEMGMGACVEEGV